MVLLYSHLALLVSCALCHVVDSTVEFEAGDASHEKTKYFREENTNVNLSLHRTSNDERPSLVRSAFFHY